MLLVASRESEAIIRKLKFDDYCKSRISTSPVDPNTAYVLPYYSLVIHLAQHLGFKVYTYTQYNYLVLNESDYDVTMAFAEGLV